MEYVEYLRVRRALVIFAIVIFAIEIVNLIAFHFGTVVASGSDATIGLKVGKDAGAGRSLQDALRHVRIPFEIVVGAAGYGAIVFATFLAASLNRENAFAHFAFTKPISRARLALRHYAIDGFAILGAFAIAIVAIMSALAAMGEIGRLVFDRNAFWVAVLCLGVGFMWYGLLQAATAAYPGKGGALVGWSWLVFSVLAGVRGQSFLGPIFGPLVNAFDFIDPLTYAPSISSDDRGFGVVSIYGGGSIQTLGPVSWGIAIVACAIAIRLWKRVEA